MKSELEMKKALVGLMLKQGYLVDRQSLEALSDTTVLRQLYDTLFEPDVLPTTVDADKAGIYQCHRCSKTLLFNSIRHMVTADFRQGQLKLNDEIIGVELQKKDILPSRYCVACFQTVIKGYVQKHGMPKWPDKEGL